jgi:hypothetical protein
LAAQGDTAIACGSMAWSKATETLGRRSGRQWTVWPWAPSEKSARTADGRHEAGVFFFAFCLKAASVQKDHDEIGCPFCGRHKQAMN